MSSGSNPGLSKTGRAQALALKEKVVSGSLPKPTHLLVSPKFRTQESFQDLALAFGLTLQILEDLLERKAQESQREFDHRIQRVLQSLVTTQGSAQALSQRVVFLCTHYDWLEDAGSILDYPQSFSWHPMSYLGFEWIEESWVNVTKGQVLP